MLSVSSAVRLSLAELTLLLEGIDLKDTRKRAWHRVEARLGA